MARKKNQPELPEMEGPGVAPVRIKAIDKLADAYIEIRDQRVQMTPQEVAAKQSLIAALHKHADKLGTDPATGVIVYRYDTILITLEPGKEKLRVKTADEDEVDLAE
jgi:hypothetical protein